MTEQNAAATPNRLDCTNSSNIEWMEYKPADLLLTVAFRNGSQFQYKGYRPEHWAEALKAESIGKYFAAKVRGKYESVKVEAAPKPASDFPDF